MIPPFLFNLMKGEMTMPGIREEPLQEILRQYDIKVLGTRNESYKDKKGVWWVETPQGHKILKKISNSEETLRHILHAVKHLTSNGIHIPAVNPTRSGDDYAKIDGVCYVLSDAITGKTPSYDSSQELALIVKELGRFHKASKGFAPLPGSKPKYHLGTWYDDYQEQLRDMENFYHSEISKGASDPIAKLVLNEFPYFANRAQEALEGLQQHDYLDWVEKAGREGCLCHQDYAAGNLILTSDQKIFILDTDSLTIDIAARDLRKLLNKIMKKSGKWNADQAHKVMVLYQSTHPLTPSQWRVVKLDLLFPHLFLGAMNKYYYQRDKEWSYEKYHQRLKEMSAFEKTITPFLAQFDTFIP